MHHRWLSLVLVVSLIDSVLVETSSEAADETAEESVRLLAVGRFAGARGQRALRSAAARSCSRPSPRPRPRAPPRAHPCRCASPPGTLAMGLLAN